MATLSATELTLLDWARRLDPDKKVAAIAEVLGEVNEILMDIPWIPANNSTGHVSTIRTGLPAGAWRKLNYGVPNEKSTTAQVTDALGMLESYAEVDKDIADLNGNTKAFRASEDKAFIEGMGQTMSDQIFTGDASLEAQSERFTGLEARFNDTTAGNGAQIIDAGETADLSSVWLLGWGQRTIHGIFKPGNSAGLSSNDLGEVTIQDANTPTGQYQGYRTHYKWDAGIVVRDWRYVVRIANVNTALILADPEDSTAGNVDLPDLMVQGLEQLWSLNGVRPVFYLNRGLKSALRRQITKSKNVNITMNEIAGPKGVTELGMFFNDVPVRRCDSITSAETQVT